MVFEEWSQAFSQRIKVRFEVIAEFSETVDFRLVLFLLRKCLLGLQNLGSLAAIVEEDIWIDLAKKRY
jgi:hypothetical protein